MFQPITPFLLQLIDRKMNEQQSLWYAALKGYIQGESDIMTNLGQIAGSIQVKKVRKMLSTKKMLIPPPPIVYNVSISKDGLQLPIKT